MSTVEPHNTPERDDTQGTQASVSKLDPTAGKAPSKAREFGGPKGLEPTRYGDWEKKGRCIDF